MRYYFASWSCSSAPVGAAASCCVVVCVRIEQSRLIDKKTPPLIGRSPRPPSPSLRCRSDSRARFPLTTTLGELGGLGGQRLVCVLFRLCPRLHHCFCRFGQWRVNMAGQTLQICRKLADATADRRAGRVRVRLVGLGGRPRSRKSTLGSRPVVARHAATTRTRYQYNDSVP